jgi:glycosyltransferase involved in cell wall biosynthesis
MKICYLADAKSVHTQRWAVHFAQRGHEVSLVSFSRWAVEGIDFHHIDISTPFSRLNYLMGIGKVKRIVKGIKPDILHAHYLTGYGLLGVLSGYHPLIVSIWGTDVLVSPRRNYIYRSITEYVLSKADCLVATSNALKDAALGYTPSGKKVSVVPLGVDLSIFSPHSLSGKKGRPVIGAMKELKTGCGVEHLIRAMALIRAEFPEAKLLIAGDGKRYKALKKEADGLGLRDAVCFTGRLQHLEVPEFLSGLNVFVMPSMSEGFGVGLLEASAVGVPVIASRVGGTSEVVLDGVTGYLVPPGDLQVLAERIAHLIRNRQLRIQMGQAGREFVRSHYRWEDSMARMESLYLSCLTGR